MIELQIFVSFDRRSLSIAKLCSDLKNDEVVIYVRLGTIRRSLRQHGLARLLRAHNMCAVLRKASATFLAAGESRREENPQYYERCISLHFLSPYSSQALRMLSGTTTAIDVSQITADVLACQRAYTFVIALEQ